MHVILVSNKEWHRKYADEIAARGGCQVTYIKDRAQVSYENFLQLRPDWVFFPHWSYIIPAEVYENFRCVIFHMTDLPFGRGGSPLQNLIARKIYETRLSALRCTKELDAGDIYLKRNLSLWGTAQEIYMRAAELGKEMMIEILQKQMAPEPQKGDALVFKRRCPEDGNISGLESLADAFDYIRMLDAETYPAAFLDTASLHVEFSRASLREGYILADARISLRDKSQDR